MGLHEEAILVCTHVAQCRNHTNWLEDKGTCGLPTHKGHSLFSVETGPEKQYLQPRRPAIPIGLRTRATAAYPLTKCTPCCAVTPRSPVATAIVPLAVIREIRAAAARDRRSPPMHGGSTIAAAKDAPCGNYESWDDVFAQLSENTRGHTTHE